MYHGKYDTHTGYQVQPQGTQVNEAETDTCREKVGKAVGLTLGLA